MIPATRRFAINALVIAIASVMVSGCGGSKPSVTKAQTVAYIDAVNLREGDVPSLSTRSDEREPGGTYAAALARCGGTLPGWEAGSVRSVAFAAERGVRLEVLFSAVKIESSPAAAKRDLAAERTPAVRSCTAKAFAATAQERGPLVRESTSASPLQSTVPSATDSFGLMVTNRVTHLEANPRPPEHNPAEEGIRLRTDQNIAWDILGFASGRAEVALTVLYEPGHPPVQNERALLSLLYGRAKAHKL
jgi:hypothetical protein